MPSVQPRETAHAHAPWLQPQHRPSRCRFAFFDDQSYRSIGPIERYALVQRACTPPCPDRQRP